MKMGATMKSALQTARQLGATVEERPRKPTLDIRFPSGRKERVMKSDRTAPRNLFAAIKAESKRHSGSPAPEKPRRPEKCTKAKASPASPHKGSAVRHVAINPKWETACHKTGEIVFARMFLKGQESICRLVIVEAGESQHVVVGLTKCNHYHNGEPRIQVPDPGSCGLGGPAYLWSPRTKRWPRMDVLGHCGWADESLLKLTKDLRA